MPSNPHFRTHFRALATVFLTVALVLSSGAVAFADTIAGAQARAAQVQAQVLSLKDKAEIASEQYNLAQSRYSSLTKQVHQSRRTIATLDAKKGALQGTLDTRATALYRQGPLGFLTVLLNARNLSDFDSAYQMLSNMSRNDALTVAQLKAAKEQAAAAQVRLVSQQKQAGVQQRAMADNERQVKSQLAASTQVLAQADSTVQTLIAEQQAQEVAAARAEARRVLADQEAEQASVQSAQADAQQANSDSPPGSNGGQSSRRSKPRNSPTGSSATDTASASPTRADSKANPSPAGSKGLQAVYWAEKKLGAPYVWAAAGPNSFDCSGLTMWAYGKVGVSLPHYSGAQIDAGKRVSKSNLQPGDLVFFGSPIHHVGMYVGGGDFIEAPYSGANVRITRLSHRDDFAGACRP